MMNTENTWCKALGIEVPHLEAVRGHSAANTYALLLVALLERGEPMPLTEVAKRFEEAGVAPAERALLSLKRCRPARPPIYRDGDLYSLDTHDSDADLWAFRLGLRPPRVPRLRLVRPEPEPLPSPDEPLTVAELQEAWRHGVTSEFSALRTAVCVLDAHDRALRPEEAVEFVAALSKWSMLRAASAKHWHRGAPIRVKEDGRWELDADHLAVRSARKAVRDRVEMLRRPGRTPPDPAVIRANLTIAEEKREAHARRLARLRRVIVHTFPARDPRAVVLLDVNRRQIETWFADEFDAAREKLAEYDLLVAVGVRGLLQSLDFDPGDRRLAELGPPQKTKKLNRQGRTLKITLDLLVRGSCEISRPFGDAEKMRGYLRDGKRTKLSRRLVADAKSLFALYQYGRLHGAVRLRWGFLDEMIRAPWVHYDELSLHRLVKRAWEQGAPLEIIVRSAPGWKDPWSRARRVYVQQQQHGWHWWLMDADGNTFEREEIQLIRLAGQDPE